MFRSALLVATLLMAAPAWAVNKCTGPDGKVAFQDAPCTGKGEKLDVRPASGHSAPAAVGGAQIGVSKLKRDNDMAEAIRTHKPLVGMTVAQLQEAMGVPTKVNANNYNGTQSDQVIYERPQETWVVYTRNGVVESIQHRPGAPIGATPARATRPCPTQHEINNAITSASSMTVSDAERAERWKTIRVMQTCGK